MANNQKLSIYSLGGYPSIQSKGNENFDSRIARLESMAPYRTGGGQFAPSAYSPINADGVSDGKIDLTKGNSIHFKGSMSPAVVDGTFACTTTTTTITWYWDGTNSSQVIVLRRSDGTSVTVPPGSITVTGLTASQTYTYYAFWPSNGKYSVGWAGPGDIGTPAIAFSSSATNTQKNQAAAMQVRAGFEPLTGGGMTFTQPASGTGGGSGGGGGTCVMLGTDIRTWLNQEYETEELPNNKWVRIETDTKSLNCTPDHPLYDCEYGKVEAQYFLGKDRWILTESGEEKVINAFEFEHPSIKVKVKMKSGHIFWANGFMSHNIKWSKG